MATGDITLFHELKVRYPEVPDDVLKTRMKQCGNDKTRCMETLANESPKYLFGSSQGARNCHDITLSRQNDINFEPRPRSDSSGSNKSNTSSCSASSVNAGGNTSSRPTYNSSQSLMMVPGYRGPIIASEDAGLPNTAPVLSSDINQFMHGLDAQQAQHIPNISCNNTGTNSRHYVEGYNTSGFIYGGTYAPNLSGNSPPTPPQKPVLRPIEVQHIQTSTKEPLTYQTLINPSQRTVYITSNNQPEPGWTRHPVHYKSNYQNVNSNTAFSQAPRSLPVVQSNSNSNQSYISPSEDRNYGGLFGQQNQFTPGTQHLSQAHIFLQTPNTSNQQLGYRLDPAMHSPVFGTGQYESNIGGVNDYRMSPNFLRSPSSPGQPQIGTNLTQQSPQQQFNRPLVVEIRTSGPEGVASQIHYFNKLSGTGSSVMNPGSGLGQTMCPVLSSNTGNSSTQNFVPCNPPHSSYVDRLYTPERPSVINLHGTNTASQGEGFMQFPPMPNYCRVPAHQHTPIRSASTESEPVLGSELEVRHVRPMPLVSPASSHSSLSSDTSAVREQQRPRSGSIEDPEYMQALLSHQKARMDKLMDDMMSAEVRVKDLKAEVTKLESSVIERKRKRSSAFPSSVDLARLRGDNLQLQADIQLLTREIDLYNNGQTPLGITDPLEQQSFYKNMNNTGQRGSIYASASSTPPMFTSTVTTSISTLPTSTSHTRLPPDIPPTLPPRDTPPPLPPRMTHVVPPAPPLQPIIGSGDSEGDGEHWNCSACTFLNHPALNKCECCEMPRMTTSSLSSPRDVPDTFPNPGPSPK